MRVTFNTFPDTLLGRLQSLGGEQNKALTQLSTGQRIAAPSDDAPAMQRILNLRVEKKQNQQFYRNAVDGLEKSKVTFSSLEQIKDLLVRASELAAGINGTTSQQDFKAKASEINQLIQQGVNVANTKLRGNSLFAGDKSLANSFNPVLDNIGNISAIAYNGSDQTMQLRIGESDTSKLSTGTTAQENGSIAGLLNEMVRLRDAMNDFSASKVTQIRTAGGDKTSLVDPLGPVKPFADIPLPFNPSTKIKLPPNHELVSGDKIQITLADGEGTPLNNGIYFIKNIDENGYAELSETENGPAILIDEPISSASTFQEIRIEYPNDRTLLPNPHDLKIGDKIKVDFADGEAGGLESGTYYVSNIISTPRGEFLQLASIPGGQPVIFNSDITSRSNFQRIGGLQELEDTVLSSLSRAGTVQYRLEVAMKDLETRYDATEQLISTDADIDFAEATVRLNRSQMAYQAAIQSGAMIQNNSLLDYIR